MTTVATKIVGFLSGGLGSKIIDGVKDYFPPSMSEKEKSDLQLKIMEITRVQENELIKLANEQDVEFNQRIKDMEGTAADLKAIPIIGNIIIFLRGCIRPIFCYVTIYMDLMVLSGGWNLSGEMRLQMIMLILNILVLGFVFGERGIKNIMPLITKLVEVKK